MKDIFQIILGTHLFENESWKPKCQTFVSELAELNKGLFEPQVTSMMVMVVTTMMVMVVTTIAVMVVMMKMKVMNDGSG